jgi:hypothetical protein
MFATHLGDIHRFVAGIDVYSIGEEANATRKAADAQIIVQCVTARVVATPTAPFVSH